MLPTIFVVAVLLWSFEQVSLFLSLCFTNPLLGVLQALGLWFLNFLFSGIFLQPSFVNWPFRIFCELVPFRWAVHSIQFFAFHGTTWEGAVETASGGFSCNGDSFVGCYGATGDEVLDTLSLTFPVDSSDSLLSDLLYIFLYGAFFKCLYIALAVRSTSFVQR